MASKGDRVYFSGKHTSHGVNVQVTADPAGRLIWASPALPGARHDAGAAKEHGITAALAGSGRVWPGLAGAGVSTFADTDYIGAGATTRAPFRRLRHDPSSHRFIRRELSTGQKAVNTSIPPMRAPGERANVDLKSWRLLRKIRSSPAHTTRLVNTVQVLILKS